MNIIPFIYNLQIQIQYQSNYTMSEYNIVNIINKLIDAGVILCLVMKLKSKNDTAKNDFGPSCVIHSYSDYFSSAINEFDWCEYFTLSPDEINGSCMKVIDGKEFIFEVTIQPRYDLMREYVDLFGVLIK